MAQMCINIKQQTDNEELPEGDGIWAADTEKAFQEALSLYPPCGRRKIILCDEGKMYGRNELIARYIYLKTGKKRTRKQVSSHIQVLARRKLKLRQSIRPRLSSCIKTEDDVMQKQYPITIHTLDGVCTKPNLVSICSIQAPYPKQIHEPLFGNIALSKWGKHEIASQELRLVEFSAFMEARKGSQAQHLFVHIAQDIIHSDRKMEEVDVKQIYDKFPADENGLKELFNRGPKSAFFLVKFWADLNYNILKEEDTFYGTSSIYEAKRDMTIVSSTKVCSFGKQVVEKIETGCTFYENGLYFFRILQSPMCDYMVNFIHRLRNLPEKYNKNTVLENFTVLNVLTNNETEETLLCMAFMFEISTSVHGAQHNIYRLV